tara:strand:+ start:431 stop:1078 length:648 start_codon:yes stop_codon:yes gene_type:complete
MPIYNYICEDEHIHDCFKHVQDRLNGPPCKTCGKPTQPTLRGYNKTYDPDENRQESTGIKVTYRYGKPKHTFHFRDAVCNDCGEESFVDCTNEDTNEYDRSVVKCEHCGSKNLEIKPACHNIDRFSERFPYFDRGLGMWLKSKAHRREMCRKLGVKPVDGDIDHTETLRKAQAEAEEDKKILKTLKDRVDNHPGYADYRRLKDRGWSPNFKHRRQ